jgi:RloB-like protein
MTVVNEAIDAKQWSDRLPKKRCDDKYDEVWAVFDRDDHPLYTEAQKQADDNKIHCANSDPSFELWLLLHFHDQTAPIDRKAARKKLKQHLPKFDKHVDFVSLAAGLDEACLRAKKLRQLVKANKTDGNPSTKVNRLVASARAGAIP